MDIPDNENNEYLRLVGRKVAERRKSLGMTQEQLAEIVTVHLTYVSHIETGKTNASVLVYRRIADALRVPLPEMLDVGIKVENDALMKAVVEIKRLPAKEQRMMVKAIRGLIDGLKWKE